MIRFPRCIADIVLMLSDADFYHDHHQKMFNVVVMLWNADDPVDMTTVANALHEREQIEDIGGYSTLVDCVEHAPTPMNTDFYATKIKQASLERHLKFIGYEIARDAEQHLGSPEYQLEQAEKKIFRLSQVGVVGNAVTLAVILGEAGDRIDARCMGTVTSGVKTGLCDLDELITGFGESELIVLAARPSVGKTAFAITMAHHMAVKDSQPVFFASLEQSRVELGERLLCLDSGINSHILRTGRLNDGHVSQLMLSHSTMAPAPMYVDDSPGQNILRISANARRLKAKHGIKIVFIDYLQLIEPESRRESRQEQVSGISRRLKSLAKELEIPVVAVASMNRNPEERPDKRPRLSDLRESGSIESDADTVILLHRADEEKGIIEAIVAKQRNGPTGSVTLMFRKETMKFENFAVGVGPGFEPPPERDRSGERSC